MTQDGKSQKRQSIDKEHKVKKEPEIVLSDSSSDSEEEEDSNDRRQDQVKQRNRPFSYRNQRRLTLNFQQFRNIFIAVNKASVVHRVKT